MITKLREYYRGSLLDHKSEEDLVELISSITPEDSGKYPFDLYMFLGSLDDSSYSEETKCVIQKLRDQLCLMAVLSNNTPIVVNSPRESITSGVFVDDLEVLDNTRFVITNYWQEDDRVYFSERITTDSRGLKHREVLLPRPSVPGYLLENDLIVDRFEIMRIMDAKLA